MYFFNGNSDSVFMDWGNGFPVLQSPYGGLGAPFTGTSGDRFTIVFDFENYRWIAEPKDIGWDSKRRNVQYYCAGVCNATALETGQISANVLYAIPIYVLKNTTFDRIAIKVTVGASGNVGLGIYNDLDCYPNERVWYEIGISVSSAGVKARTINVPFYVDVHGPLLWLVIVSNTTPTIVSLPVNAAFPILGFDSTLTTAGVGWSVPFTYAVLPATFPAGASPITASPIPAIFLRSSAW